MMLHVRLLDWLDLRATGRWFLLAGAVGVVAGLGAVLFQLMTQLGLAGMLGWVAGYHPGEPVGEHHFVAFHATGLRWWGLLLVLTAGGLVVGVLVQWLAPEAEGHGTDAAIEAFHQRGGEIAGRVPLVKMLASAITLGSGGSGGREGPIAQIGAGFGSRLSTWLGMPVRDRRVMLACGMAAGIGAIFRAPLAGALFAAEILYSEPDLESDVIVPAAIASVVSYSVYCLFLPAGLAFAPLFGRELDYGLQSLGELLPLTALAVLLALAGGLYIKVFYGVEQLFKRLPVPAWSRPAIGALLAGLLALGLYHWQGEDLQVLAVLATGYGALQEAVVPGAALAPALLLTIAVGKVLTTSLTIGSGGSGGVFGPSMVIGGTLGGAVGFWLHAHAPSWAPVPQTFVIVGMAGFFAGCARAPISTVIMVLEMTGGYRMLLPTMWVSTLCFVFGSRWTLYRSQVASRLASPAHRGDFLIDVLEGITVREVYDPRREVVRVPQGMTLDRIVHLLAEVPQSYFPVVDGDGRMVGIFSASDVREYLYDETIWQLTIASDVMTSRVLAVTPDDDLNVALQRFTEKNIDELPVLDIADPGRIAGWLRRKDAIAVYNRRILELKQEADA